MSQVDALRARLGNRRNVQTADRLDLDPQHGSLLLSLPAEIRNRVYDFLFTSLPSEIPLVYKTSGGRPDRPLILTLGGFKGLHDYAIYPHIEFLMTCQQFYNEMIPLVYKWNNYYWTNFRWKDLPGSSERLHLDPRLSLIKTLRIYLNIHWFRGSPEWVRQVDWSFLTDMRLAKLEVWAQYLGGRGPRESPSESFLCLWNHEYPVFCTNLIGLVEKVSGMTKLEVAWGPQTRFYWDEAEVDETFIGTGVLSLVVEEIRQKKRLTEDPKWNWDEADNHPPPGGMPSRDSTS